MNDPTNLIIGIAYGVTLITALVCMAIQQVGLNAAASPPAVPRGKVAVWYYQPQDLLGPLALFLVYAGFFTLSAISPPLEAADISASMLVFNIGFQGLMAAAVTTMALRRTSLENWSGLRWAQWPWLFLIAPGCVVGIWTIFAAIQACGYMQWMESLGAETVQETVTLLQDSRDPVILTLMIITAVIIAPVCEELVFRGYLYPILKKYTGLWPGVFCSALLFSIAHGNITVLLPLFILGALLVWLYEKTGSLWAPIAVHFCFNAATVVVQTLPRLLDLESLTPTS